MWALFTWKQQAIERSRMYKGKENRRSPLGIHGEEPTPILYLKFFSMHMQVFFLKTDSMYFIRLKGILKKVNYWFKTFNSEHKHPGEVNFEMIFIVLLIHSVFY